MINVAILGGSGYTALELLKILLRHHEVSIRIITSRTEPSPKIQDVHPILRGRIDLTCEPFQVDRLLHESIDCVFACLPHGASMSVLPDVLERGIRVVDLSADYRLRDPNVYAQWYGASHGDVANLTQAVYGLPELFGDEIADAHLVANPGCYPQTGILGLAPLVAGKYLVPGSVIIDSKSGVSGAGRAPKLATLFSECNESVSAYAVGKHRHTPEIEQILTDVAGEPVELIFTPHLMPMDKGIFSTIYASPQRNVTEDELLQLFRDYYSNSPFVRVVDGLPKTKDVAGTNYLDLTVRCVRNRIVILACECNLVRGASGVAVQNFNRMFGFDETTALIA